MYLLKQFCELLVLNFLVFRFSFNRELEKEKRNQSFWEFRIICLVFSDHFLWSNIVFYSNETQKVKNLTKRLQKKGNQVYVVRPKCSNY